MIVAGIALLGAAVPQAVAPLAAKPVQAAAQSRDKLVCKRFVEIGSLVRGRRECKTEAEWQRERDYTRQRGDLVTGTPFEAPPKSGLRMN